MSLNKDSATAAPVAIPCAAQDEMLTRPELAAKLKICLRTVENWIQAGYLPYLKINHLVLFYWPDVVQHLKANFSICYGGESSEAGNGTNESHGANATKTKPGRSRQ